ncbi:fructose-1,6-bisphosphatase [Streptomyces badius]
MSEHHLPSQLEVSPEAPDRNLALELVRVTEAAAWRPGVGWAAAQDGAEAPGCWPCVTASSRPSR